MIDLVELARTCLWATNGDQGRWAVSRSNGTITSTHVPTGHESTVAFAIATEPNEDGDRFAKIDIGERDALFIEAACPAQVMKLVAAAARAIELLEADEMYRGADEIREMLGIPPPIQGG